MIMSAGDVTDFLSINLTTIIATWLNLLILFLVLKHFLFDKVNKVMEDRKNEVAETYKKADEAEERAKQLEQEYEQRISGAKEESARIIQAATRKAQQRSDEMIADAKVEAKGITEQARNEIEREKKIAVNKIKDDITDIAFQAAQAVIEKDLSGEDNERLISEFIDNVGEG
ncbi:F0F1 ATP synthase subunit B [Ruminococcus sp.]|uniref:F0F1 ATP synthase subunit B n=1 Tax=Ruminococcus sp. TaxID=41978 RepID=UPI0025F7FB87|nr:F0F1 ATP synthase subunit B [Ruminococcus sp.]MBQ8965732.1 F0F1 ATP synthase subunit B [Ruminococcus sp.]